MKIKGMTALILALILCSASVSCGKKSAENNETNTETDVSIIEDNVDSAIEGEGQTKSEPEEQEAVIDDAPAQVKYINPLTGYETTEELSKQRPVAVMFNNIYAALPQVGIGNFDVLYEITVEGAITRLMGVATDWASLPTIGSVRSSRDYFIDISDAHNAIYVHAGGSDYAYSELWARGTDRIDGTNGTRASGAAFYRDPERKKTMALEHTLVTNGEKLAKAISENGFETTYKEDFSSPLSFSDTEITIEGTDASYVYIPFSYYAQSYLDYNSDTKLYAKGQYLGTKSSLDKHSSPHIDGNTKSQLQFKNVIILLAAHSSVAGDTKGRISVDITGSGQGYYITNGKCKEIIWEKETRTSSYKLYEMGKETELLINPGKSYIAIAPTNSEIVFK